MTVLLALLIAAAEKPPFDVQHLDALARQHCTAEWPDDFRMQEYCLGQQREGARQFAAASQSIGRPLDKAMEQCVEEWTSAGVPDFAMIGYCADQQATAYRRLHSD